MKLILFFLFSTSPNIYAFDWSYHRSITTHALSPLGFSTTAIDQIADANISIDVEKGSNHAYHVDSESFEAASALMRSHLYATAISVMKGDVKSARASFGYLTHTVQDFYAHTNYVELMPGKPIDLFRLNNPKNSVTCSRTNLTNGLTSGYYPDSSTPAKKCSHFILNKDSGSSAPAIRYAESATAQVYDMLEQEVLSTSSDQQKNAIFLRRFRGEDRSAPYDKFDDVANTAYNQTFKVIPFAGVTQYSSNEVELESEYTAGVRIESRLNERVVTGIGFTYSAMTISELEYSSYGVDIYTKFYLISESRFQPYVGAGVGYLKSGLNENDSKTLYAEAIGGMDLMYTRSFGANLELKYSKAMTSSSYFGKSVVDDLSQKIENAGHLILTVGLIISY